MDAWLTAHLPWLSGPWGYAVLAVTAFIPLVFVASRRGAGFDTYWRMPLHVLGVAWNFVNFAYFDVKRQAEPFEAAALGTHR